MKRREAGIEAYLDFLQSLRDCGDTYFVEGGQAVNYWAEYINAQNPSQPLEMLRPFTSKDCDIWISHTTWERLKKSPGGQLRKGTSPADGQLGILTLQKDQIDPGTLIPWPKLETCGQEALVAFALAQGAMEDRG